LNRYGNWRKARVLGKKEKKIGFGEKRNENFEGDRNLSSDTKIDIKRDESQSPSSNEK